MDIKRDLQQELLDMAAAYPVVTITGPRQSGKTTLVKACFPDKVYINLESPDIRRFALDDPKGFLAQYPDGLILDEVQHTPELLSYIQVIVDENSIKGQYILTGSHQLLLQQAITQSLAGRTALLNLFPLSLSELSNLQKPLTLDEYLLQGFYPRIYKDNLDPTKAYRQYIQTYVERDLRMLINVKDIAQFQQFLRLCAGYIGQVINYSNLANRLGTSHHTIKNWLSILEAGFIIHRLQPYHSNIGKQLIKSPKLYFTDIGLACYLLKIETQEQLFRDPIRGALFENLVVLDFMKTRYNQGLEPNLFFYRDSTQHEVDLIYQKGSQLIPIEIKSSTTFHPRFIKGIEYFQKLFPQKAQPGYVVYAGDIEQVFKGQQLLNFQHTKKICE